MPQKVDKHGRPLPGFTQTPERIAMIRRTLDENRQKRIDKAAKKKFLAEPEELAILETIEKLPPGMRQAAAEGALIARLSRRKKIS